MYGYKNKVKNNSFIKLNDTDCSLGFLRLDCIDDFPCSDRVSTFLSVTCKVQIIKEKTDRVKNT